MATYQTELEALNAIYDLLDSLNDTVVGHEGHFTDIESTLSGMTDKLSWIYNSAESIKGYTDGIEGKIDTTNTKLDTLHADVDGLESTTGLIKTNTDDTNTKLDIANTKLTTLHTDVDQVESKLDTANANLTEIIGETIDIRNVPTDTCIIRVYIGDRTEKREAASRAVTKLLSDGYRPYMVMGISEDLARVLFVKYPAPNSSVEPEPGL